MTTTQNVTELQPRMTREQLIDAARKAAPLLPAASQWLMNELANRYDVQAVVLCESMEQRKALAVENKTPSCPEASQPDALVNPNDFLSRHPTAVVFSAAKRQWGTQEDLTCAEWIWGKIIRLYEQAAESDGELVRPKEPNWVSWANEVRLMCTQDNRNHRQICELYGRVNRDPFWCKNILSPSKLREKWDELSLKLSASASKHEVREDPMFKSKYECDTRIPEGFRG
jgi:hypothetical protein